MQNPRAWALMPRTFQCGVVNALKEYVTIKGFFKLIIIYLDKPIIKIDKGCIRWAL